MRAYCGMRHVPHTLVGGSAPRTGKMRPPHLCRQRKRSLNLRTNSLASAPVSTRGSVGLIALLLWSGLRKFWATLRRCRAQRTRTVKAIRLLQPLLPGLRVVEQFGLAVTDAQLLCHLPRENPSCNTARARAGKYSLGASRLQGWPRPQHNLARLHRIQHMCTQCASPEPLSFAAHCL